MIKLKNLKEKKRLLMKLLVQVKNLVKKFVNKVDCEKRKKKKKKKTLFSTPIPCYQHTLEAADHHGTWKTRSRYSRCQNSQK